MNHQIARNPVLCVVFLVWLGLTPVKAQANNCCQLSPNECVSTAVMTEQNCIDLGGIFHAGHFCDVATGLCTLKNPNPIPTVSEWAAIMMTLLLLTAGTIVFGRRSRPEAV